MPLREFSREGPLTLEKGRLREKHPRRSHERRGSKSDRLPGGSRTHPELILRLGRSRYASRARRTDLVADLAVWQAAILPCKHARTSTCIRYRTSVVIDTANTLARGARISRATRSFPSVDTPPTGAVAGGLLGAGRSVAAGSLFCRGEWRAVRRPGDRLYGNPSGIDPIPQEAHEAFNRIRAKRLPRLLGIDLDTKQRSNRNDILLRQRRGKVQIGGQNYSLVCEEQLGLVEILDLLMPGVQGTGEPHDEITHRDGPRAGRRSGLGSEQGSRGDETAGNDCATGEQFPFHRLTPSK